MDAFLHDLRLGVRALARRPAFTVLTAGTLSLGFASAVTIFSVVDGVLFRPLPYEDPAGLVTLRTTSAGVEGGPRGEASWAEFTDWREASSFASMAAWSAGPTTLTGLGEPEVLAGARVTSDFFRVFGAFPVVGRGPAPEETVEGGPAVVVVSHAFWEARLAADPDVLSRSLELDGAPHQVVGVAAPGFAFPAGARLWRPVQNRRTCGRGCRYLDVVARLADGVPLERARREVSTLSARAPAPGPDGSEVVGVAVVPLHETVVGDVRPGLLAIAGAVVLVLLIACANVANLLILRGAQRTGEVALRSAVGARRGRIVRQLLAESLVLAAVAGGLGFLLAAWGLDLIRATAPPDLPRMVGVGIDGRVAAFGGALVVATTILFGSGPALRLARMRAAAGLGGKGAGPEPIRPGRGRTVLLVVQVAVSLVLLSAAGLLLRSSREIHRLDPGFDARGVLTFGVSLPASRYPGARERRGFVRTLEERLVRHSRVEVVGSATGSPLEPEVVQATFRRPDQPLPRPGEQPVAVLRRATPGYFRTLRIDLMKGRLFDERDAAGDPTVVLVSEEAAHRWWPGTDPVGQEIVLGPGAGRGLGASDSVARVVGVVADTRAVALTGAPPSELYLPFGQASGARITVHVRALPGTGGTDGLVALARDEVRALDPDLPLLRVETLEARVRAATARSRFHLALFGLFAVVALSLAAVGLYGVVACLVSRRTREMGIRLALGAEAGHVVRLVLRQGLLPALVGVGLGVVGAVGAGRLMRGLLFRVAPSDPRTLVGVTVVLLTVVLVASLVPARRAARIRPSRVLRAGEERG